MTRLALLVSLVASAMTTVTAHPHPRDITDMVRGDGCGTESPAAFANAVSKMASWESTKVVDNGTRWSSATTTGSAREAVVTIDTYVHVVAMSEDLEDGWATEDSIVEQIAVLNKNYGKSRTLIWFDSCAQSDGQYRGYRLRIQPHRD